MAYFAIYDHYYKQRELHGGTMRALTLTAAGNGYCATQDELRHTIYYKLSSSLYM